MTQWNEIYKKDKKVGTGRENGVRPLGEGGQTPFSQNYKYYDLLEPYKDMDRVIRAFKKGKVEKVLDLGCGAGRNLWYMAEKGFSVWGIDSAKDGLKIAADFLKKKKLKATLRVGDVFAKLPYPDGFFDAVVSVQVLQHSEEKGIKAAVKEILRVLKPGGFLFATLCGRVANGEVRYCLVKTATKIAPHTYKPNSGSEKGLTHFIYNKELIRKHYKDFKMLDSWKDEKDYYCFIAKMK